MENNSANNTDKEIWCERPDDYYSDRIHVTEAGSIGINCGGYVFVKPIRDWHALAKKDALPPARPQSDKGELLQRAGFWINDVHEGLALSPSALLIRELRDALIAAQLDYKAMVGKLAIVASLLQVTADDSGIISETREVAKYLAEIAWREYQALAKTEPTKGGV